MKIALYTLLTIACLLCIGHKIVDYKFINYQEASYKALADTRFAESPRHFPDSMRINDTRFWQLISDSKSAFPTDFNKQVHYLEDTLSSLSDTEILGFECIFREQIIRLWDYNAKALYQITNGRYISTDDFIYFRAYLISLGSSIVYTALHDPDHITVPLGREYTSGEEMLYVADNAYALKHKAQQYQAPPRDQAQAVDYDTGNYRMTGTYVPLTEFGVRYPNLTAHY